MAQDYLSVSEKRAYMNNNFQGRPTVMRLGYTGLQFMQS